MQRDMLDRASNICRMICVALVSSLVFLVPFEPLRNIDMQGLILLIAGAFGTISIGLTYKRRPIALSTLTKVLLSILAISCIASLIASLHSEYSLFGAPYVRLGSLGLLSCLTIAGVIAMKLKRHLIKILYCLLSGMALVSVPYNVFFIDSGSRTAGLPAQADIFGMLLVTALLLGIEVYRTCPTKRLRYMVVTNQILLCVLLISTGTRAAIILAIVGSIVVFFQHNRHQKLRYLPIVLLAIIAIVAAMQILPSHRLTDASYASESIQYRLDLQHAALLALPNKPLFGYGMGDVADAIPCSKLHSEQLQETCRDGYFFTSSHNIYLDRALGLGILGGLAYVAIVVVSVYKGLRAGSIFSVVALCIALYYLTNVTSVALELLFWIVLFRCLTLKTNRA